jgi:hypothetical protein
MNAKVSPMPNETAEPIGLRCNHWPGQSRCEICGMGFSVKMVDNQSNADYERGLRDAAAVCSLAALRLLGNGKVRVNQVDRHTAEVLRSMEQRILALKGGGGVNPTA